MSPDRPTFIEEVPGSDVPVELTYLPTWDGLYTVIGLRVPEGDGPHPLVLLASGNGGGGMPWIREAVAQRGYIMERLLEAGFACAWLRYRTEVELGYDRGGALIRDTRQGRGLFSRSPLEYEDEIAVIEALADDPRFDPARIGLIGMSHGGEMILKLTSEFQGVAAAVASEPAAHEFLALEPDESAFVDPGTGLRNIEEMQMTDVDKVKARIDRHRATARIASVDTPILVMGRDDDHLQGIFRTTYDLLEEAGKDVEWVSWDHPLHGYVYPVRGADGAYEVNEVQDSAISGVVDFLSRHLD